MVANQKGLCKLCELPKKLVVDHCHETGKVRGLLCRNCNLLIGHAKEDIVILQNAINYLKYDTT